MKEYKVVSYESICRVCGFDEDAHRYDIYDDGEYLDKHIICSCCGCQSGLDDYEIEVIRNYRNEWLTCQVPWLGNIPQPPEWDGTEPPWFSPEDRPADWDLADQMLNIPEIYR